MAVEIAVTTDAKQEKKSIRKALHAGFDEVILVSTNEALLRALTPDFGKNEKVKLFSPPDLFSYLEGEPLEEGVVAGYRVKVAYEEGTSKSPSPVAEVLMRNLKRLRRQT